MTLPFLLLAAALTAQPVTHESLWLMKRVGAPQVSPDGRWVAFSLTVPAYDDKDQSSDLWLVPTDRSAKPRQITFTKAGESGVAWSPDSRRIAFTARRENDESPQIYILDVAAGGEARRVTTLSTGANSPKFSPDGSRLLFQSPVFPGALTDEDNKKIAADRKARKYRVHAYDAFPIRHWDRWLDDTRPHIFITGADGGTPKDVLAGTALVKTPGFGGDLGNSGDDLQPAWSPDGASVVFIATTNRNAAAYSSVITHLYTAPADGGEPKRLTADEGSYSRPVFRPDGKALYATFEPESGKIYTLPRVVMYSWPDYAARTVLTAKFDRAPNSLAFTADSKVLYFLAEDSGYEKIYYQPAASGDVKLAVDAKDGVYTNLQIPAKAATTMLIANWGSATRPAEVVRLGPGAGRPTMLTEFTTEAAAKIDWPPLRAFTFTSKRGKPIHNFLALPPAFDESKKYPLFVLIHGGPAGMWRDEITLRWNYHLLAQPGYVVLLTNYTGSTGFGEKFAQDIQGDPLRGPADEINEAADEAIRRFPFIDASRQAAGGASYGGHLANWLEATTTRYKCLIAHAGLINAESQWGTSDTIYHREIMNGGPVWEQGSVWKEQNPARYAANFKTPILVTVGERDYRVPLNQTIENWSLLQRMKVPSRLLVFPDANHWILKPEDSRYFYQEVHSWLAKWLKG